MLLVLVFSVAVALITFLAGIFVLLRNNRNRVNIIFSAICLFASFWTIAFGLTFYYFLGQADPSKVWLVDLLNRSSFALGMLLMLSMVLFTYNFPRRKKSKLLLPFVGASVLTAALSLSKSIAGQTIISKANQYEISVGEFTGLYLSIMVIGVILTVFNLLQGRSKLSKLQRNQNNLLIIGFGAALLIGLIMAVILPLLFPDKIYDAASPLAVLFFLIPVATAVTRSKLFDLRLIVARSVAYLLSFGVIIALSALVLFGLSNQLVSLGVNLTVRLWLYVLVTIIFSVSYQPLKRRFDLFTKKLFFMDAYDTQTLLNEFNQTIVTTIDLNELLKRSTSVIENYLKPTFCMFAIREGKSGALRVHLNQSSKISEDTIEKIRHYIKKSHSRLFVTDDLPDSANDLRLLLQHSDVAAIARITTDIKTEGSGYIILGYKKSGNIYNSQDVGAIEIITNELAIAIQNALRFEEIEQFNITLQGKVDDATRQLRRTNEKLKQLDETKDEFISMASHQLRTPLTSVKGYVSMVMEGDAGKLNSQQKKLLDQAFLSSQRMVYLIADLLNVSRLKTGKFVIESKPTNLAELVEGELEQLKETAKSRNLELTFHKPKEFPTLMLDETKIRQVVMNFADNAIYYTPSGGHIQVNVVDKPETIELTVVDDGLGVPKHEQPHLFGKFYRAGNAKKARPDGTGLGLFMAKKVIIAQGGSIIFKSEEGKGSTFGFTFAKSALAIPAHLKTDKKDNKVSSLV